jgi:hypothetical protein
MVTKFVIYNGYRYQFGPKHGNTVNAEIRRFIEKYPGAYIEAARERTRQTVARVNNVAKRQPRPELKLGPVQDSYWTKLQRVAREVKKTQYTDPVGCRNLIISERIFGCNSGAQVTTTQGFWTVYHGVRKQVNRNGTY